MCGEDWGENGGMVDLAALTRTARGRFDLVEMGTKPPQGVEKAGALARTEELGRRMEGLFDQLFFAGQHSLLVVLQGMDTSGKDGAIRHVLRYTHAQSCRVASFKAPTELELSHDFLWRCHARTPGKGEIVVFNRSYYEDVGVVRVHGLAPERMWRKRYGHIRAFEELLADSGTVVVKFWLHISFEEQEERLRAREAEVDAAWKLSVGDWEERKRWGDYQAAYSEAIGECASESAPWVVVPADKKWYRNLVVTQALVERLEPLAAGWRARLESVGEEARADLAAYRASGGAG